MLPDMTKANLTQPDVKGTTAAVHAMKAYVGVKVRFRKFITFAFDGY
jgi:hypothetical protein